jgi:hypothetical protein
MWKLTLGGYGNQGCVSHTVALPFTLKSILRQKKKNYGKLKYFTMQKLYNLLKGNQKSFKILL